MRRTKEEAEVTRSQLRDAALVVFAERGYAAARLEEIAARAGVTRGALYHHYAGKPELYVAVVGELWWEVTAPIFSSLESDDPPLERLERFLVAYIRAIGEDPRFRALLTVNALKTEVVPELEAGLREKERALEGLLHELEALLSEAWRRGELAEDVQPADAARSVLCIVNGVTTSATTTPGLLEPRRDARALVRVAIGGLRR